MITLVISCPPAVLEFAKCIMMHASPLHTYQLVTKTAMAIRCNLICLHAQFGIMKNLLRVALREDLCSPDVAIGRSIEGFTMAIECQHSRHLGGYRCGLS